MMKDVLELRNLLSTMGILGKLEECRDEEEVIGELKRENLWGEVVDYPELEALKESYENGEFLADGSLSLSQLDKIAGGQKANVRAVEQKKAAGIGKKSFRKRQMLLESRLAGGQELSREDVTKLQDDVDRDLKRSNEQLEKDLLEESETEAEALETFNEQYNINNAGRFDVDTDTVQQHQQRDNTRTSRMQDMDTDSADGQQAIVGLNESVTRNGTQIHEPTRFIQAVEPPITEQRDESHHPYIENQVKMEEQNPNVQDTQTPVPGISHDGDSAGVIHPEHIINPGERQTITATEGEHIVLLTQTPVDTHNPEEIRDEPGNELVINDEINNAPENETEGISTTLEVPIAPIIEEEIPIAHNPVEQGNAADKTMELGTVTPGKELGETDNTGSGLEARVQQMRDKTTETAKKTNESKMLKYGLARPESLDAFNQGIQKVRQLRKEGKEHEAEELLTELRNDTQEYFNSSVRRLFKMTSESEDIKSLKQEFRDLKKQGKPVDVKFIFGFGERVKKALTVAEKEQPVVEIKQEESPVVEKAAEPAGKGEEEKLPVAGEPVVEIKQEESSIVENSAEPAEEGKQQSESSDGKVPAYNMGAPKPENTVYEKGVPVESASSNGKYKKMFEKLNVESNLNAFKVLADEKKRKDIMPDDIFESLVAYSDVEHTKSNSHELAQKDPLVTVHGIEVLRREGDSDEQIGKTVYGKEFETQQKKAFYKNRTRWFGFRFLFNKLCNTSEYNKASRDAIEENMKAILGNETTLAKMKLISKQFQKGIQQYGGLPPTFGYNSKNDELTITFRNRICFVKKTDIVTDNTAGTYLICLFNDLKMIREDIADDDIRHRIKKDVFIQLLELHEGDQRKSIINTILKLTWVNKDEKFNKELQKYMQKDNSKANPTLVRKEPELMTVKPLDGMKNRMSFDARVKKRFYGKREKNVFNELRFYIAQFLNTKKYRKACANEFHHICAMRDSISCQKQWAKQEYMEKHGLGLKNYDW